MPGTDLSLLDTLRGSILISTPKMANDALEECVIYIYDHSPQIGAQGIVINRKSGLTVEDLLERMNYIAAGPSFNAPLYHGGLDEENGIAMLHTGEWFSSNTRPVTSEISISSDTFMLEKLVNGNEPVNWLMCAGKCSWEPGELEEEIKANFWLSAPGTNDIVFSAFSEAKQWRTALEYCTKYTVDSWF